MNDQEFLDIVHRTVKYKILLELSNTAKELDAALLRIKNREGISESYYEYTFCVDKESLSSENPHLSNFLEDISVVFDKYKDKGIKQGDWESKGMSYPMGLEIVKEILEEYDNA